MTRPLRLESHGAPGYAAVDVVFVHGFGLDARSTWTWEPPSAAETPSIPPRPGPSGPPPFHWPSVLAEARPEFRIWTLDYDAPLAALKQPEGFRHALAERLPQMLDLLANSGIGTRPVVWVGHSLGGLTLKLILQAARMAPRARWGHIAGRTFAVVFLATPHEAASLASLNAVLPRLVPGAQPVLPVSGLPKPPPKPSLGARFRARLKEIFWPSPKGPAPQSNEALLRDAGEWYREYAAKHGVETRSYHEAQKTAGLIAVEPGSADPGVTGCASLPVDDADHADIARPDSTAAPVFRCVTHLADQAAGFADAGGRVAVFEREIAEVVKAMKANGAFAEVREPPRSLADVPEQGQFRLIFGIAYLRACRQLIEAGQLRVEDARAAQGQASSNDLDKMLLYAWHEHGLRKSVRKARELVEDEAARVRIQRQPALIPLYRAAAGLSRALGDELPPEFAHELRALAGQIEARAEAERIDAAGATRAALRRLADKLDGLHRGTEPEEPGEPGPAGPAPD
jgi:hypothetical protein